MNRKRIVAGVVGFLSLVLLAAACASDAPDPMVKVASTVYPTVVPNAPPTSGAAPLTEPTPPDRATLLEDFSRLGGEAMAKREWAFVHALYPKEFREKCAQEEFAWMMGVVWPLLGVPEDAAYVLDGVWVGGDYGWIDSHYEKAGVLIEVGNVEKNYPGFVWRDGGWTLYVSPRDLARDNPCSLDVAAEEPARWTPRAHVDDKYDGPLVQYALRMSQVVFFARA